MSKGFGPDELLACYARGTFPMADGRDDPHNQPSLSRGGGIVRGTDWRAD